jgi:hypothetical protein
MIEVKVNAKPVGTCPACGVDINTGVLPEEKPKAAAKKQLTQADIFFRFLMWTLGLSTLLGILSPYLK